MGTICGQVHLCFHKLSLHTFYRFFISKFYLAVMGTSGLEPPTSRLSGVRSNHLSYAPIVEFAWRQIQNGWVWLRGQWPRFASQTVKRHGFVRLFFNRFALFAFSLVFLFVPKPYPSGGDEEDRTPDPLLAKQVLSQLSYTPAFQGPQVLHIPFFKLPFGTFKIEQ